MTWIRKLISSLGFGWMAICAYLFLWYWWDNDHLTYIQIFKEGWMFLLMMLIGLIIYLEFSND